MLVFALALALQTDPAPLPKAREPAPWGALLSAEAAMDVAFTKVCLPAMLESRSIEDLAVANRMIAVSSRDAGAGPQDKVWRLASLGRVYVVAWADGACSSSSERGDATKLAERVLAALRGAGVAMAPGAAGEPAANGGRRDVWCGPGPNPVVLAVTTRADKRSRRPAILTTLFKARSPAPPFCERSL